ncbi:MAG: hypothetical protein JWO93_2425 [Micrococcaceae bacterium]|nr:hypothetical protein [Micrococcaceae bacterium]
MSTTTVDNTTLRLKSVLDVLRNHQLSGSSLGAGAALAEAIAQVPLDERESELLSGGIPRGHKALTTATAKLVKAGWLVKGRSGWTITEDGLRATVAFPEPESFAAALVGGTPVPADTPLPTEPVEAPAKPAPKTRKSTAKAADGDAKPARKARPKKDAAEEPAFQPELPEPAAAATAAAAESAAPANGAAVESAAPAEDAAAEDQPESVAIAGDFNTHLGAPENWSPQYDEAQMSFDADKGLWVLTVDLPANLYHYKVALNRSWDENYGAYGVRNGADHELHHAGGTVTFSYDHRSNDISISH